MASKPQAGFAGAGTIGVYQISSPDYPPLPLNRLEIAGSRVTVPCARDCLFPAGFVTPQEIVEARKNSQTCFIDAIRSFVHGIRTGQPFPAGRLDHLERRKLKEAYYVAASAPDA